MCVGPLPSDINDNTFCNVALDPNCNAAVQCDPTSDKHCIANVNWNTTTPNVLPPKRHGKKPLPEAPKSGNSTAPAL